MATATQNSEVLKLIGASQEVLTEISSSEPAQAYISLVEQIALIDAKLSETTGWFWKKLVISDLDATRLKATRDVYRAALSQVIKTMKAECPTFEVHVKM